MFKMEIGSAPPLRNVDNEQKYREGWTLGVKYQHTLSTAERRVQEKKPVRDSFDEGFRDALQGNIQRY